jgi:hypothetical protein
MCTRREKGGPEGEKVCVRETNIFCSSTHHTISSTESQPAHTQHPNFLDTQYDRFLQDTKSAWSDTRAHMHITHTHNTGTRACTHRHTSMHTSSSRLLCLSHVSGNKYVFAKRKRDTQRERVCAHIHPHRYNTAQAHNTHREHTRTHRGRRVQQRFFLWTEKRIGSENEDTLPTLLFTTV